ncbi:MAG: GbsR/MarR family transcriptional regulator, partial [Bradyrhizobium sp.]
PARLGRWRFHFILKCLKHLRHTDRHMLSEPRHTAQSLSKPAPLGPIEMEAIEMFINFFRLLGLPKSVGEIYGLLFVSPRPLTMDDLMNRLDISLGAASQGLKALRSAGAVKAVYSPGERRDHFVADLELSRFAASFIKEQILPKLEQASARAERMEAALAELPEAERPETHSRINELRRWLNRGRTMLPVALKLLS